jgi:hypothetical protein
LKGDGKMAICLTKDEFTKRLSGYKNQIEGHIENHIRHNQPYVLEIIDKTSVKPYKVKISGIEFEQLVTKLVIEEMQALLPLIYGEISSQSH